MRITEQPTSKIYEYAETATLVTVVENVLVENVEFKFFRRDEDITQYTTYTAIGTPTATPPYVTITITLTLDNMEEKGGYHLEIKDTSTGVTVTTETFYIGINPENKSSFPQGMGGTAIKDLYSNPRKGDEWDLVIIDGKLVFAYDWDFIGQKAKQILQTFQGEIVEDSTIGVPWFEEVIGVKNPNISSIVSLLSSILLEDPFLRQAGIDNVSFDEVSIDNRKLIIGKLTLNKGDQEIPVNGVTI